MEEGRGGGGRVGLPGGGREWVPVDYEQETIIPRSRWVHGNPVRRDQRGGLYGGGASSPSYLGAVCLAAV